MLGLLTQPPKTRRRLEACTPSARQLLCSGQPATFDSSISSGSISLSAPAGSKPDRSKILPNVTSAYCEKLYTQARAVFSFHLRLHACGRAASRRSRYAATLPGQPAFGSPNGAYPRTSGAGSTTARSRSQHRSAGRSRVAPGLTLISSQRIKTAGAKAAESADAVSRVLARTDTLDPVLAKRQAPLRRLYRRALSRKTIRLQAPEPVETNAVPAAVAKSIKSVAVLDARIVTARCQIPRTMNLNCIHCSPRANVPKAAIVFKLFFGAVAAGYLLCEPRRQDQSLLVKVSKTVPKLASRK